MMYVESQAGHLCSCQFSLGKNTPVEVRRAGAAAFRQPDRLQVLLEQWVSCNGAWKESAFYFSCKEKSKTRRHGSRKWMTVGELASKYGDRSVADLIVSQKEADPDIQKEQVRPHPDLHGLDTPETLLQIYRSILLKFKKNILIEHV